MDDLDYERASLPQIKAALYQAMADEARAKAVKQICRETIARRFPIPGRMAGNPDANGPPKRRGRKPVEVS